ncbi:condensation domain-containing protein [Methylocystis sp. S23]
MRRDIESSSDLIHGPLHAFAIFKIDTNCFFYYHRYHHVVFDGFSVTLFARRVGERYASLVAGSPLEAQAPGCWLDILRDEESYQGSSRYTRDRDYWMARLKDRPERVTLSGRLPPVVPPRGFIRVTDYLPYPVAEKLRTLGAACGASLAQVITAAAVIYLHRFTGERDIVVGMPASARVGAKARSAQGMMVNVLPLRLAVDPELNFEEFLREATRTIRDAFRHQRYRSEDLCHDFRLRSNEDGFHGLVVNVISFDFVLDFAGCPAQIHNISNGPVFELSLNLYESKNASDLRIDFNGNPSHYTGDCLLAHMQRLLALLSRLVDSEEDGPIAQLSLLRDGERHTVLYDWNATAADYPHDKCVHALFEEQAARTPDAAAVIWNGGRMTYAELNGRANQLARYLLGLGVQPSDCVAILLERSPSLVIAELAILKCGAIYVPLDPDFPERRLAFMIADCATKIVVCQEGEALVHSDGLLHVSVDEALAASDAAGNPNLPCNGEAAAYVIHLRLYRRAQRRRSSPPSD